jgi:hypothetical protein
MCDEAELCDLTVDLLCLSQELIHAKLRLENSAKVRTDVLETGAEQRRTFYQCCGSGMFIPDPGLTRSRLRVKEFKYF